MNHEGLKGNPVICTDKISAKNPELSRNCKQVNTCTLGLPQPLWCLRALWEGVFVVSFTKWIPVSQETCRGIYTRYPSRKGNRFFRTRYFILFLVEGFVTGFIILMKISVFILFFIFSFSAVLHSQTANGDLDTVTTDEIIVTANRILTSQMLAPNSVHIMTKDVLVRLNSSCLSDALSNSYGVYIRDYGFGTGLKTISLNSTQTEHTLVLLNGIRLNSKQNAQYDLNLLMTDLIDRIEISKGGSSSLYGSEAIGGVVNLITSDFSKSSFYELKTEAGSYNMKRFFIHACNDIIFKQGMKLYVDAGFSIQSSDNDYEYKFFNGLSEEILRRVNAQYKNRQFSFSSGFFKGKNTRFSLFLNYSDWDRNIPPVAGTGKDASAKQTDRDIILSIGLNRIISSALIMNSAVTYKYSLMKYADPLTFNTLYPINSFYKQHSLTATSDIKVKYSDTELDFGAEYSFNNLTSNETEYASQHQFGMYSASKLHVNKIFTIFPVIRYDFYSGINKNVFTGKLGLNLKPFSKTDISLKASAGNNFRLPTFNELFWKVLGNKNLNPEKSLSFDAGVYYKVNSVVELVAEISYYNTLTYNRIIWQPDAEGLWRPGNIGEVKSQGVDFSISVNKNITRVLSISGGFNYNYGSAVKNNMSFEDDPSYGKQIIYTPKEFAKANLLFSCNPLTGLLKEISLNVYYNFTGKRFTDPENLKFVQYYETVDANINSVLYMWMFETGLKFSVNNLFNKNYEVMPGYPMALRNYRVQLSIKY